ncbi:CDP-alcohol phosphatidyltransferase family protein [Rhizobium sp. L1K21]|uniref:CDP-alcohol phosphatidyltransferase family protein n=1 Tax=Rhizobium sp. L1K21 TaxID=2954933 RepID=UPI0020936A5F|nr:CDP-alcohol phosphatidyltransferase family protein [Rhizobium sp. L1K21]MCO6186482.1 CDP-alcohol phosphatidyltransferase family protein [Rhizobium sp. L1K21]
MNLPNLITVVRFLLVPAVVYALLHDEFGWAFAMFLIAGISDGIDGIIARRFNQQTALGAWLDPLADKLLMVSVFVSLAALGILPDWFVFLAVSRDVLIVGAVAISSLMMTPIAVKPLIVSKANTVAQITLASLFLASESMPGLLSPLLLTVAVWLTAVLTIASGASYLGVWLAHMSDAQDEDENR